MPIENYENRYLLNMSFKTENDDTFQSLPQITGESFGTTRKIREKSSRLGLKAKRIRLKFVATNVPGLLIDHIGIIYKPKRVK